MDVVFEIFCQQVEDEKYAHVRRDFVAVQRRRLCNSKAQRSAAKHSTRA